MSEIWVGKTEVSKAKGCELDFHGVGAFVWWATQAGSEKEFLLKLQLALDYYKLILIEASMIRQFSESDEVSDDFYEMVEQARQNERWTVFGTFYSWPHHSG